MGGDFLAPTPSVRQPLFETSDGLLTIFLPVMLGHLANVFTLQDTLALFKAQLT